MQPHRPQRGGGDSRVGRLTFISAPLFLAATVP